MPCPPDVRPEAKRRSGSRRRPEARCAVSGGACGLWHQRGSARQWVGIEARQIAVVIDGRPKGVAMAKENVVVVRFAEPSKAYQALSVLKECDASGRIGLESGAVVDSRLAGPRLVGVLSGLGLR